MRPLSRLVGALVSATLAVTLAAPVLTGPAGAATPAGGGDGKREAARLLDAVPVFPESETDRARDRVRTYVVTASPAEVVSFYRDRLPLLGWQERSTGRSSDRTSETGGGRGGRDDPTIGDTGPDRDSSDDPAGSGGPEVGNRGPEGGGIDSGTDPNLAGRTRLVFTRPGARLGIVVEGVREGDSQAGSTSANAEDHAEYRLEVKAR